jgi:hypothetical protein
MVMVRFIWRGYRGMYSYVFGAHQGVWRTELKKSACGQGAYIVGRTDEGYYEKGKIGV